MEDPGFRAWDLPVAAKAAQALSGLDQSDAPVFEKAGEAAPT